MKVNFDLPNVAKMVIKFELLKVCKMTIWKSYISSHGGVRNIKFGQRVNLIQRLPLGTPPWEVVISLPCNFDKSLYLYLQRSYCYQIWAIKTSSLYKSIGHFSTGGSNVITFWSRDINKSLYFQL